MRQKIKKVTILVSDNFFKDIFEKERRKIHNQLFSDQPNLSQVNFTEFLANSKAYIKIPKTKFKFSVNPNIKRKRRKKCRI